SATLKSPSATVVGRVAPGAGSVLVMWRTPEVRLSDTADVSRYAAGLASAKARPDTASWHSARDGGPKWTVHSGQPARASPRFGSPARGSDRGRDNAA